MKTSKLKPIEPQAKQPEQKPAQVIQQKKKPKITYWGIFVSDIKSLLLIKDKVREKIHPEYDSYENWKGQL